MKNAVTFAIGGASKSVSTKNKTKHTWINVLQRPTQQNLINLIKSWL